MTLVDAVKKMRGPRGSKVNLSIKREGVAELIDFNLIATRSVCRACAAACWIQVTAIFGWRNSKNEATAMCRRRWRSSRRKKAA